MCCDDWEVFSPSFGRAIAGHCHEMFTASANALGLAKHSWRGICVPAAGQLLHVFTAMVSGSGAESGRKAETMGRAAVHIPRPCFRTQNYPWNFLPEQVQVKNFLKYDKYVAMIRNCWRIEGHQVLLSCSLAAWQVLKKCLASCPRYKQLYVSPRCPSTSWLPGWPQAPVNLLMRGISKDLKLIWLGFGLDSKGSFLKDAPIWARVATAKSRAGWFATDPFRGQDSVWGKRWGVPLTQTRSSIAQTLFFQLKSVSLPVFKSPECHASQPQDMSR